MKHLIITMLLAILMGNLFSQNVNPFPKTIDVTGSAEMEIVPDQIYVQVTLKEYERRGYGKVNMESIKADFINQCHAAGLPDSVISIAIYQGTGNYWYIRKRNRNDLFTSISYQLTFSNTKQIDNLVERLDDDATQAFSVVKVSHSKIQEYRRQLKIAAIRAAKEKGSYLAEAINEKLGDAVSITEPEEISYNPYRRLENAAYGNAYLMDKRKANDSDSYFEPETGVDFKKIHLKFDVKVVFGLK